jgi:hypothetical protein
MKYIKPETTYIKLELSNIVMGSEKGILKPEAELGSVDGDGDNIVMAKGGWVFSETDDNGWPKQKSLWDE